MRVALTGPALSGKTSLAKALSDAGWTHLNFTDEIKRVAAVALTAIDREYFGYTEAVTVEDIKRNKAEYRPLLQILGTLLGFDQGLMVEALVESLGPRELVVFDNVRTEDQAAILRDYGFVIVKIDCPDYLLVERLRESGADTAEHEQAMQHAVEHGVCADFHLDGRLQVAELVSILSRAARPDMYAPKPPKKPSRPKKLKKSFEWYAEAS